MNLLASFLLMGVIDSHDGVFATVELSNNPAIGTGPTTAIMPVSAFPCNIQEGKVFYVVKLKNDEEATIVCQDDFDSCLH